MVAASVIGVGSPAVWQFTTLLDTHLMNVRVSAWIQAAVLFALGVSLAFTLWCLTWMRRRWPTHGPLMAKAGRASYATCLLHPVVLVSVMPAFREVPLSAPLKFLVVSVVAVPVCFAVGYALPGRPVSGAWCSHDLAVGRTPGPAGSRTGRAAREWWVRSVAVPLEPRSMPERAQWTRAAADAVVTFAPSCARGPAGVW